MKTRFNAEVLFIAVLGFISIQAKADLVYDNGPITGTLESRSIALVWVVSNSFTASGPASLASAEVGLWVHSGQTPLSFDWAIGTTVYGSEISRGNAALTNTYFGSTVGGGYSVFDSVFAINGLLTSGTYYFTLKNAVTQTDNPSVFWDTSGGPSIAFQIGDSDPLVQSQAFKLFSKSTGSVPDASATIALLGSALAGVALMRRQLMS